MTKIYKRQPIKQWDNTCGFCCMSCDMLNDCDENCIEEEITCNQCILGGDSDE